MTSKLAQCRACGREVSRAAPSCPHCGEVKPWQSSNVSIPTVLISLLFLGALIRCVSSPETEQQTTSTETSQKAQPARTESPPLNYSLPIITDSYAIICPQSLFFDRREDHGIRAIYDVYISIWNRSEKAAKLGCEEWQEGIRVYASKMQPPLDHFVQLSLAPDELPTLFTMESHLKNLRSEEPVQPHSTVAPIVESPTVQPTRVTTIDPTPDSSVVKAQTESGPSFDCAKAKSVAEHLICADAELSARDRALATLYLRAKATVTDLQSFRKETILEWKQRETQCTDRACLLAWYDRRQAQLAAYVPP